MLITDQQLLQILPKARPVAGICFACAEPGDGAVEDR